MAGIKCLGSIMRSTSRISSQMSLGLHKNIAKDISYSKQMLSAMASLNRKSDVLNAKAVKMSMTKFYNCSPMALGCLATISPLLIETLDSTCSDMLDCLGSDDDSDTWSLLKQL